MRFIMIRPSHYISNSASATLGVTLASAALLVVCFGARSALADGPPGSDTRLAREQTAAVPSDALISPDGKRSVWVREDVAGFWYAERSAGGAWSNPVQIAIRGVVRSPAFSPDGNKLAFENARGGYSTQDPDIWGSVRAYPWGFIAIFNFDDERISYVNPSFAEDRDPRWSSNDTISYTRHIEGVPDAILTSMIPRAQPRPVSAPKNKALLEALLATPLVYQPVAAADGRSLAFVARVARTRAIYFLRVGESAKPVVRYSDDDGQDLTQVALSPDGSLLSFVRGGPPNSKGEVPNPRSLATPPLRQVWLLDTAGGAAPRPVGIGYAPQFSPDGARLIWLTERGVASVPLLNKDGHRSDVGAAEILLAGPLFAPRFSPDGNKVAYERSSYVEVFDLKSRATWAVAKPADAVDVDPAWSPDGESIALRRLVGSQPPSENGYAGEYVAKEPWAIQVASVATHQVREVWRADPGMGSAYYDLDQDPTDTGAQVRQLFWSDGNDIAFTWERDGWRHLYAVSAQGGPPRLLTPGEGEVETAALSLDRKTMVYSTNIGDPYRRHIAAVAFGGGVSQVHNPRPHQPVDAGTAGGRHRLHRCRVGDAPDSCIAGLEGIDPGRGRPSGSRRVPFIPDGQASAGQLSRRGWTDSLWPVVRTDQAVGLRSGVRPRRNHAADAARLSLHGRLLQPVRAESIFLDSRMRRSLGRISQQHHARLCLSQRAGLGKRRCQRIPGCSGRSKLPEIARRS